MDPPRVSRTSRSERDTIYSRYLSNYSVLLTLGCVTGAVCTAIEAYKGMDPKIVGTGVGCALWVVNPHHPSVLAPVGVVGELILEGPNVAREYLNTPEKTKLSFLTPDSLPWLSNETSVHRQMFRTGDLVSRNEDGTISFAARVDGQIKVRGEPLTIPLMSPRLINICTGQRVEIAEIEHTLRKKWPPGLDIAVENMVVDGPERSGGVLTAFLCVEEPAKATTLPSAESPSSTSYLAMLDESASKTFSTWVSELRLLLAQTLPSYMVPALYLPLKKMPMSSSKKKDRKLLKSLGVNIKRSELEKFAQGPRNESLLTPLTEICGPISSKFPTLQFVPKTAGSNKEVIPSLRCG
jgi:acyl-CoA synthetase (AMP-forming)/AMP-acid ligase II